MSKRSPITYVFVLLAALVVFFLVSPTWATDRGDDIDIDTNVSVSPGGSGDNSVSHTSRALGLSGGDVDIAQCYRSYSYAIIWQDTRPNLLCLADLMDAKGLHDAAAKYRCSVRAVRKVFASDEECIALNTMVVTESEPAIIPAELAHHEEKEEQHDDRLDQIEAALQAETARRAATQRAVERAAAAARKREAEEQQYAQQALEDLEKWK